jgi:hypothetical protein
MNTTESKPISVTDEDAQAIMDHLLTGKPLDPAVARRVREASEQASEETRRKFGTVDVAVDLIREARDQG